MTSEEQRQSAVFYAAIMGAIDDTAASLGAPILNSVFGGLVFAESHLLARLDDDSRKILCEALERQRPALWEQARNQRTATINVIRKAASAGGGE